MFIECEYVNKNEIYYWKLKIVHDNQTHGEKAANKWIKKAKKWKKASRNEKVWQRKSTKTKRREKKTISYVMTAKSTSSTICVCMYTHIQNVCIRVYCIIFSHFFVVIVVAAVAQCFRSLLAFYLIFFDFAMLTETSNTWTALKQWHRFLSMCVSIRRIRFIIIYPVSSRFLSSFHHTIFQQHLNHHHRCQSISSLFLSFALSLVSLLLRFSHSCL